MKALNVLVRSTPVGLVGVLPPLDHVRCCEHSWDGIHRGDVLGVVTKCKTCEGKGYFGEHDDEDGCWDCDGTGYAPLRFVKVLAVWRIVGSADMFASGDYMAVTDSATWLIRLDKSDVPGFTEHWAEGPLDLPDAEPGGVALHVEWTDCPRCEGERCPYCRGPEADYHTWCIPCPTCQTPPTVEGDGPIVVVK